MKVYVESRKRLTGRFEHKADCELVALLKKVRGEVMREGEERIVLYERDEMLKQIEALQQANGQLQAQLESLRCTSCGEIPAMVSTDDGQYCEKCAEELDAVEMIDLFNYHNPADVEALQQEVERLQVQNGAMREALEEATETIENIYEKDTPQTEKYRDILNVGTTEYHNQADMEALKQAREALKGVNVVRCPYCWGKETHSDKCEISKAIENIDKAIGGKEDA